MSKTEGSSGFHNLKLAIEGDKLQFSGDQREFFGEENPLLGLGLVRVRGVRRDIGSYLKGVIFNNGMLEFAPAQEFAMSRGFYDFGLILTSSHKPNRLLVCRMKFPGIPLTLSNIFRFDQGYYEQDPNRKFSAGTDGPWKLDHTNRQCSFFVSADPKFLCSLRFDIVFGSR